MLRTDFGAAATVLADSDPPSSNLTTSGDSIILSASAEARADTRRDEDPEPPPSASL